MLEGYRLRSRKKFELYILQHQIKNGSQLSLSLYLISRDASNRGRKHTAFDNIYLNVLINN